MQRSDFPFSKQDSYAALPWIVAFMVFLLVLSLAFATNLHRMAADWHVIDARQITLHIPASDADKQEEIERLIDELQQAKGIADITYYEDEAVQLLLTPWLGEGEMLKTLPLPQLIAITIDPAQLDIALLERRLRAILPSVEIDDHAAWLANFQQLVNFLRALSYSVVALIIGITTMIITMSTRTELALHYRIVDLLRYLGAEDKYIAQQFQTSALWMTIRGVVAGSIAALLILIALDHFSGQIDAPFMPLLALQPSHSVLVVIIALASTGMATLVARFTVLKRLQALNV